MTDNIVLYHGKGVQYYCTNNNTSVRQEGIFIYGKLCGACKIYWDDKLHYEGELSNGLKHGQGKSYHLSCIEFAGLFTNDKFSKGKLYWTNNYANNESVLPKLKFDGEFNAQNKYNGPGILYYQNGYIDYQGDWINGNRTGDGTSYYETTGSIEYLGKWLNDERHGIGILYDQSGTEIFNGLFSWNEISSSNIGTLENPPSPAMPNSALQSSSVFATASMITSQLLENVANIYHNSTVTHNSDNDDMPSLEDNNEMIDVD